MKRSTEFVEDKRDNTATLVKGEFLPNLRFKNKEMLAAFGIDEHIRKVLLDAEYYHYLCIQIRINTVMNILLSAFGFIICIISYLSMDYVQMNTIFGTNFHPKPFILQFAFACYEKNQHFWDLENPLNPGFPKLRAETNFTCQIIYIYLASTFQIILLYTIPYFFNRFDKSEKERKQDKEKKLN